MIELISAETPTHFQIAATILNAAAQWMRDNNTPNWHVDQFDPVRMQQKTDATIYLALLAGTPVGTVQLQDIDSFFWPEILLGDTIYVHKLAMLPEFAGQRIGYHILDAVCAIGRQRELKWVRLDCREDRPKLRQYYENYGFQLVDIVNLKPTNLTARYQLKLDA